MIRRAVTTLMVLMFAGAAPMLAPSLRAQETATGAVSKQELARGKFQELTERMQKLMVVLQKDEPDESRLLSAGLRYVQEKKLHDRLAKAGGLLRDEAWDQALVEMDAVREDLRELLDLLQNRNEDLRKLLERIEQLEAFKDRVAELAKDQQQNKDDAVRAKELEKHLENINAQKQRAEALLQQQQELRAKTNELPLDAAAGMTEPLEKREGALKKATDELSKDLRDLEKKGAELAKDGEPKDGEPKDGESKPGEPTDSEASPSPGSPSGAAGKASKSMGKAQEQLGDKKPESSLKDQDQAIEALKQAVGDLEEMAEAARRELLKLPFEQVAKDQEKTQHATDTLAKDMEKAQEGDGESEGQPTPGCSKVQQAVPKQRAAAGKLKEYKEAKQEQQDAKDNLDQAQKELEEALAQLRQQLQDEVLRALEERFTAMLAQQRELTIQTATVHGTRGRILTADGSLPAGLVSRIDELAGGEGDLEQEAIDALKLLDEDGTTAVFPPMVEQLRDELHDVSAMLRRYRTGETVNTAQKDIEDLLELLINALRRTIEKKEGGG